MYKSIETNDERVVYIYNLQILKLNLVPTEDE